MINKNRCRLVRPKEIPEAAEQGAVVVAIDRFGAQHVLGLFCLLDFIDGVDAEPVPRHDLKL